MASVGTEDEAAVVYRGYGGYSGTRVSVQRGEAPEQPLRHHLRHCPASFSWGYGASGPAQLARCILIDYLRLHDTATREPDLRLAVSYQVFKFEKVAAWPWLSGVAKAKAPLWSIGDREIARWIAEQQRAGAARALRCSTATLGLVDEPDRPLGRSR